MKRILFIIALFYALIFAVNIPRLATAVEDSDKTTQEKDGKIQILEEMEKSEYLSKCEKMINYWSQVESHAKAQRVYWEAEKAKYKK